MAISPRIKPISNSVRNKMCNGYVNSSASTRITDGFLTTFKDACNWASVTLSNSFGNDFFNSGKRNVEKDGDNATIRSHNNDCDSWTPIECARDTGWFAYSVTFLPCSYNACPVSWIVPVKPSDKSFSLYRVVIRTSPGPHPPVNGCTDTSNLPFSKSNPSFNAISFDNFACVSTSNVPPLTTFSPFFNATGDSFSYTLLIKSTTHVFTTGKISSNRSAVIPLSYSSKLVLNASSPGLINSHRALTRSTHSFNIGENVLKSFAVLAFTHVWYPSDCNSAAFFAISAGIFALLSYSSFARFTFATSFAPVGRAVAINAPSSSSMDF